MVDITKNEVSSSCIQSEPDRALVRYLYLQSYFLYRSCLTDLGLASTITRNEAGAYSHKFEGHSIKELTNFNINFNHFPLGAVVKVSKAH